METKDLQKIQAQYDSEHWEHNGSPREKIRHITLHIGKLLGKLSSYCEAAEHNTTFSTEQIEKEVIPDLIVYALQLSNLFGVPIDEQYLKRLDCNRRRIKSSNIKIKNSTRL